MTRTEALKLVRRGCHTDMTVAAFTNAPCWVSITFPTVVDGDRTIGGATIRLLDVPFDEVILFAGHSE